MEQLGPPNPPEDVKYFRQELKLDDKSRVFIPAAFRRQFDENPEFMLTFSKIDEKPGYLLWTKVSYDYFSQWISDRTHFEDSEHRKLREYFENNSYEANPDKQGRVHFPTEHIPYDNPKFAWKLGDSYALLTSPEIEDNGVNLDPGWLKAYRQQLEQQ
jgi:hypothetical protein